ncbi:hypothetical protein [Streptomyces mirabilis]|uniref:hypothetical protein n=1 Tax=Streptomyces mirabilis TaxID=68239 RepID=UPI00167E4960|nr:hypothetical protein [Streptomyces mirabilis]
MSVDQEMLPIPPNVGKSASRRISPKRPAVETAGLADVFPYYAGFGFDWARGRLGSLGLGDSALVLDPWNGSGTTTLAAQTIGLRSIGIDLNPVANKVAQLRSSVNSVTAAIIDAPAKSSRQRPENDALQAWFHESTVARFRDWTRTFEAAGVNNSLLGYVALFRVVKKLSKKFEGSNPTWVKRCREPADLIEVSHDELDRTIILEQEYVANRLGASPQQEQSPLLLTASATEIPLKNDCVDAVLTSPPYLTRIDYAVAYARELAILGIDISQDRSLRLALMGTTLTRADQGLKIELLSAISADLLLKVENHKSKASGGYYLKQARQYLSDLTRALEEITRVCKPGAHMMLVVQDSYYKDIPVNLADICIAESELRGWELLGRDNFAVKRTLTALNTSAQAYKKGEVAETVIEFRSVNSG